MSDPEVPPGPDLERLWRALPSFDGRSVPGTWLYRVALNTALNWRRRRAARREESLEQISARMGGIDLSEAGPQPDEQLEARERLRQLYAAIERLDDADKALVLMYLGGWLRRRGNDVGARAAFGAVGRRAGDWRGTLRDRQDGCPDQRAVRRDLRPRRVELQRLLEAMEGCED